MAEHRRDRLIDDYADGLLTPKRACSCKATLERPARFFKCEVARRREQTLPVRLEVGETLHITWDATADGWRRQVVEVLLAGITVRSLTKKPLCGLQGVRHRFDSERVPIDWKL